MKTTTKLFFAATLLASPFVGAAEMESASPESQGVSSQAILKWIDVCEKELDALHGFVIVRHGRVIAEGSWAPYATLEKPHMLYSHSKSFTSTAVGFLVDDGKLDLDERVADLLSDKMPTNASANLLSVRVRDLLTMTYGAPKDHLLKTDIPDWAAAVLAKDIANLPGTAYRYDSDATYLLACIAERKAGMPLMDFLRKRLFDPIGIGPVTTGVSPQGIPCGGWGMRMTTRDLARFGQLYLHEGLWGDTRLLSRDWVRLATAKHTAGRGGNPDWSQGYGFQFWRCRHNAYRADGASGQYTIVIPDHDAVISIHAGLGNMQKEIDTIWDHLLPAFGPKALDPDPTSLAGLRAKCASLTLKTVAGARTDAAATKLPATAKLAFRHLPGYTQATLAETADGWELKVTGADGERRIAVGFNSWKHGMFHYSDSPVEPLFALNGTEPVAASGAWTKPGEFTCRLYLTGAPQHGDIKLNFSQE